MVKTENFTQEPPENENEANTKLKQLPVYDAMQWRRHREAYAEDIGRQAVCWEKPHAKHWPQEMCR